MGHVKVDIAEQSRNYTQKYTLSNAKGVALLLRDRHRIHSRQYYAGDFAAIDILTDLHSAMNSAGLTDRQTEAIAWVYGKDITQTDAARIMSVSQQAVQQALESGCERIAAVYQRWEERDKTGAYEFEIAYEYEDEAENTADNEGAVV